MIKKISTFLWCAIVCVNLEAKDVTDSKGRDYRNPKLSLYNNTIVSRNMLGVLAITQGVATRSEPNLLFKQKEATFYQKQINEATKTLDFQLLNNNLGIQSTEKRLINIKK